MEYPRVEWTRDTVFVCFALSFRGRNFHAFRRVCRRGASVFVNVVFLSPSMLMARRGRSSFREETNFPFWCTRSRFLHAPRGEVFFSLFSFPLWKEKPIKGCWFFFPGEKVLNAVLEFCYQLFNYIDIIEQTSVSFYLSLSFSLFLCFLYIDSYTFIQITCYTAVDKLVLESFCLSFSFSLFLCFLLVYRFLYIYTDNILYSCCVLAN